MKQNVYADTELGKIKVQFEHCPTCSHFINCYDNSEKKPYLLDESCLDEENFPEHYDK